MLEEDTVGPSLSCQGQRQCDSLCIDSGRKGHLEAVIARDVQVGVQGEPLVTRQAENRDRRQCHDDQTAGMGRVAATAFVGTNQTKKAGTEIVPPWRICSSHSVSMTVVSAPGSNISAGAERQRVQLARTNTTGHAYSANRTPSGSPR